MVEKVGGSDPRPKGRFIMDFQVFRPRPIVGARTTERTFPALALVLLLTLVPVLLVPGAQAGTQGSAEASRAAVFEIVGLLPPSEDYSYPNYNGMFPVHVRNTGDSPGDCELVVTGLPEGWTWELVEGPDILRSIRNDTTVRMTVRVQASAPAPGVHSFSVKVGPGNDDPIDLEATVPLIVDLMLEAPVSIDGDQEEGADIEVDVHNTGNWVDRFTLRLFLPSTDWSFSIGPDLLSSPVPPEGRFTWTVHLDIPRSAEATMDGRRGYQVLFKVTSTNDGSMSALNITSIKVGQYHGIDIDFDEGHHLLDEKVDAAVLTAMLENLGNGPERVELDLALPDGWCSQLPERVVDLYPFQRVPVKVYIGPPHEIIAGQYTVTLLASMDNWTHSVITDIEMIVPKRHSISLEGPEVTSDEGVLPGGTAERPLAIRNLGNHLDLVEVYPVSVPEGWTVTTTPSVLSLLPWASVEVRAMVHVSERPGQALGGRHTIILGVRSLFTDEEATSPLFVNVTGVASLEIVPEEAAKAINPFTDPFPVFIYRLMNTGNIGFTAAIEFSGDGDDIHWLQPSREAVTAEPGEVTYFHATATPPMDASLGEHRFQVKATTTAGGGATDTSELVLTVVERDIRVSKIVARQVGSLRWGGGPEVDHDSEVEVMVHLEDMGTDRPEGSELHLLVDGRPVSTKEVPWSDDVGITFVIRLSEGGHNITVEARTPGEIHTEDNSLSMRISVAPAPSMTGPGVAAAGVALTSTLVLIGVILSNEGWKFKALLLLVVPMYTRIRKESTLDNFTRGRIFGYIEANPGEHYNAIKKALGLSNGCVAYHLDTLVRQDFVKFEMDGNLKRFYPKHMRTSRDKDEEGSLVAVLTRIQEIILETVRDRPGISQRQIARSMNLAPSTISYHVRVLAIAGILKLERGIGRSKCFVGDEEAVPAPGS